MNPSPLITEEMLKALDEAKEREDDFFARHGIDNQGRDPDALYQLAHKAWVKTVETEYKLMGKEVRVHLDTPIARKAFILGFFEGS